MRARCLAAFLLCLLSIAGAPHGTAIIDGEPLGGRQMVGALNQPASSLRTCKARSMR